MTASHRAIDKADNEPLLLSVIIVSFNACKLLGQCLRCVVDMDFGAPYEILVVDNGSSDGSPEMVSSRFPSVILTRNTTNLGFAKANNQAVAAAKGKYLLLLNSDTLVEGDAIRALVAFAQVHPKAAAIGPKILNLDGTLQSQGYPAPSVLTMVSGFALSVVPLYLRRRIAPGLSWHEDDITQVGWVSGSCLLLKRLVVQAIGGLCEELTFYGEEVEWCFRARTAGFEVWYLGTAKIRHLGGGSTKEEVSETLRLQNHAILCARTVGIPRALIMSLLVIALKGTFYLFFGQFLRDRDRPARLLSELQYQKELIKRLLAKRPQLIKT